MASFSETTLNVLLAERLTNKGLLGSAELVERVKKETKKPDILMIVNGIKVILEGKMNKSTAKKQLTKQCNDRLENSLCDVSIGIIYNISTAGKLFLSISDLKKLLDNSKFKIAIWIPGKDTAKKIIDWNDVDMKGLAKLIRASINEVTSSDLLTEAVDDLKATIEESVKLLVKSNPKRLEVLSTKLSKIIEVRIPTNDSERISTIKMTLLIISDAIIFYNVSTPINPISTLNQLHTKYKTWLESLVKGFDEILGINFDPVFLVARKILDILPDDSEDALKKLVNECKVISSSKALLKHDLMGRIYHMLLFEDIAKHLSTYYTSVPSAWLLARLSLDTHNENWKDLCWKSTEDINKLRIGDLACGSGTLLSAVYRTIEDKHIMDCAANEQDPDIKNLHKNLMENVLTGCDVMTFAAHIATLTLALHNPDYTFSKTNILTLPLGGIHMDLGSVNLLKTSTPVAKFSTLTGEEMGSVRHGIEKKSIEEFQPEKQSFDLLILNPPFARSCGDNLMFGTITNPIIRKGMKKNLVKILDREKMTGIGHAGLGAVFMVIADRYIKSGGRIAFVLPRNILSGISWQKIRDMLISDESGYDIEYILLSSQPGSYNFSENTALSECMIICRKLAKDESRGRTIVANFHRKADTVFESLILAKQLEQLHNDAQQSSNDGIFTNIHAGYRQLMIGTKLVGKAYTINSEVMEENKDNWGRLVAFANPEITKISYNLFSSNNLALIEKTLVTIPLKKADDIGTIGPDRKQIHSSFEAVDSGGIFDAFWGKKMEMNTISVSPNKRLKNRPKSKIQKLIDKSSKLLIAERLWLDTTSLVSLFCKKKVLSNVWWSFNPDKLKKVSIDKACKILCLWLNSTPGLLLYLAELEVTRGGWVSIKKQKLGNLLLLDIDSLTPTKIEKLVKLFDDLQDAKFKMLKDQFYDASNNLGLRSEIDKKLFDILHRGAVKKDDLIPLYEILKEESDHWYFEMKDELTEDITTDDEI